MKKILLSFYILFLSISFCYGGNVDTFGIGSKATSMGGAFCAYADDPFAAHYNPAGLHQIKRPTFSLGTLILTPDLQVRDFKVESVTQKTLGEKQDPIINTPKDFSNNANSIIVPNIGFAMPINDKISAGISMYVPWGVRIEWDSNPIHNPAAFNAYNVYLSTKTVSPSFSYQVNDKLSFGFGLCLSSSETGLERILYIGSDLGHIKRQGVGIATEIFHGLSNAAGFEVNNSSTASIVLNSIPDQNKTDAQKELTRLFNIFSGAGIETADEIGDYFAETNNGIPAKDHGSKMEVELIDHFHWSFNFGLMFKPKDTITFGLVYRGNTKIEYSGELKSIPPDYPARSVFVTEAEMEYKLPDQIQGGLRYEPHDHFTVEMDLVWTNWSLMEKQKTLLLTPYRVHVLPGTPIVDPTTIEFELERHWHDTVQLRFGCEWKPSDKLFLRAGYFYDPTPVPDDTFDFQWSDGDKKVWSLGLGVRGDFFSSGTSNEKLENLNFDGVLQFGKSEGSRYLGGESHNLNHDFDVTEFYDRHVYMKAKGVAWGFGLYMTYKY